MPALATSSRLASTPSAPHSWMPGPLTCAAVGGLPETTRDFSTVMAFSPPPPATAKSFHVSPLASSIFFSSATELGLAAGSPPVQYFDLTGKGRYLSQGASQRDGAEGRSPYDSSHDDPPVGCYPSALGIGPLAASLPCAAPPQALAAIVRKGYSQCNEHARRTAAYACVAGAGTGARVIQATHLVASRTRPNSSIRPACRVAGRSPSARCPGTLTNLRRPLEPIAALQ